MNCDYIESLFLRKRHGMIIHLVKNYSQYWSINDIQLILKKCYLMGNRTVIEYLLFHYVKNSNLDKHKIITSIANSNNYHILKTLNKNDTCHRLYDSIVFTNTTCIDICRHTVSDVFGKYINISFGSYYTNVQTISYLTSCEIENKYFVMSDMQRNFSYTLIECFRYQHYDTANYIIKKISQYNKLRCDNMFECSDIYAMTKDDNIHFSEHDVENFTKFFNGYDKFYNALNNKYSDEYIQKNYKDLYFIGKKHAKLDIIKYGIEHNQDMLKLLIDMNNMKNATRIKLINFLSTDELMIKTLQKYDIHVWNYNVNISCVGAYELIITSLRVLKSNGIPHILKGIMIKYINHVLSCIHYYDIKTTKLLLENDNSQLDINNIINKSLGSAQTYMYNTITNYIVRMEPYRKILYYNACEFLKYVISDEFITEHQTLYDEINDKKLQLIHKTIDNLRFVTLKNCQ